MTFLFLKAHRAQGKEAITLSGLFSCRRLVSPAPSVLSGCSGCSDSSGCSGSNCSVGVNIFLTGASPSSFLSPPPGKKSAITLMTFGRIRLIMPDVMAERRRDSARQFLRGQVSDFHHCSVPKSRRAGQRQKKVRLPRTFYRGKQNKLLFLYRFYRLSELRIVWGWKKGCTLCWRHLLGHFFDSRAPDNQKGVE